jgi:hypothetical protein
VVPEGVILATVGFAYTPTTLVAVQPPGTVKVIVAAPAPTPVTKPLELTVAMEVLLLLQVPTPAAFAKLVVPGKQITLVPVIAGGVLHGAPIMTL